MYDGTKIAIVNIKKTNRPEQSPNRIRDLVVIVIVFSLGVCCDIIVKKSMEYDLYFPPNVRRQVSLAGGAGEPQRMGVKALGMPCCQHPLCLNAEPRHPPLESGVGQRLTARPRSAYILCCCIQSSCLPASLYSMSIPFVNRAIAL